MTTISAQITRGEEKRPRSHLLKTLRRLPLYVIICLVIFATLLGVAIFAPVVAPADPNQQSLLTRLKPPLLFEGAISKHLLGTDQLGRDIFSRILYGLRASLGIAALGMTIGVLVGVTLGLLSGLFGRYVDSLIMTLIDVWIAVPYILLALTVIAIFGTSMTGLVVLVGLSGVPTFARLTRGQVLAVKAQPYIEASSALGSGFWRVALRHILPNIASPLIVLATLNFSSIILLESALSFLGLGVQPPTATLGSMAGQGRDYMASSPWIAIVPGIVLFLVTMVISLIGDWLRDTLDTRIEA